MLQRFSKNAYKMIYLQIALVIVLVLVWLWYGGRVAALSTLIGGLVWILPSIFFVWKVFGKKMQKFDQSMLYNFYFAEMIKFAISIFLIIVVVKLFAVEFLPFLNGYAGAIAGTWLYPLALRITG